MGEFSRTQDTELLELFTPTMLKLKCAINIEQVRSDQVDSERDIDLFTFFKICALSPVSNQNILVTDSDLLDPLKDSTRMIQFCSIRPKNFIPVKKPDPELVEKFR